MDVKQLDDTLSITGQISLDDLEAIKAAGFGSIICNRPDDEEPGQLNFAEVGKAAGALGLGVAHIPVIPTDIKQEEVAAFKSALETLPGPVFAYCKTGGRCNMLWKMSRA